MNLVQLQRAFQHHVIRDDGSFIHGINESERVSAAVRLSVYADAYYLRLVDALAHNYPRLQQLLGDDAFLTLARQYLARHPSSSFSVRWFGNVLPAYLNEHAPYPEQPWLAELAAWEWAIAAAFDAADTESLTDAALSQVNPADWPGLRLGFHSSVQRLELRTNAPALFKALSDETACPQPVSWPQPQQWLIWRQDLTPRYRPIEPDEAQALDTLIADGTFGEVCEALCEWHEPAEVPMRAAGMLKVWMSEGMIVALTP